MTILHAVWSANERLHLWAQRSPTGDRLPRPPGRRPRDGRPRRHPYAVPSAHLAELVAALTGRRPTTGPVVESHILLPSTDTSPLSAPEAVGVPADAELTVGVIPWRVDALALEPHEALPVLLAVPTSPPHTLPRPGASLSAASTIAALALELAARGQVVPGLVAQHARHEARWLPAIDRAEARRLAAVATALPPALLAAAGEETRTPGTVLRELLEQLVDACCRDALAGQRLVSGRGRRRVERAWLRALTGEQASLAQVDPADVQLLAKELDAWHRSGEPKAGLRAAFRLVPPSPPAADAAGLDAADDENEGDVTDVEARADVLATDATAEDASGPGGWRLDVALQGTDDPSLIVPASQVWDSEETARFLDRTLESPEERLLADLGRAVGLYPALARALDSARPEGLDLDLDEVRAFLADTASLLEQAGFGVLLPDELRRPERLGARLRTTSERDDEQQPDEGSGLLGYEGIVDYRWEVAVGDETLTAEELYELARLKAPLVRLRGRWVEVSEDDLDAALRLLEQPSTGRMSLAEAARIGLGLDTPDDLGLEVVGVDADGPLAALLDGDTERRIETLASPAALQGTLRPYQARGLSWLAFLDAVGLGGCLADDMGLGKSIQLLALLLHERDGLTRRTKRWPAPTLLVCPMSIVGNWEREAQRFAPDLRVVVHHGRERSRGEELKHAARQADLVVTTYALAHRDHEDLDAVGFGRIVLDEAQHIKNPGARQSRAIRSLEAPRRLALTGTPVENRLSELWSIMDFCNPGLLGSPSNFREQFTVPIERLHDDEAAARLRHVTQPFVLRRKKTDTSIISDLPDKIEVDEHCRLTREQGSLYAGVVEDMLRRIEETEGIERRGLILQTMLQLKQVCNHPAHLLDDGSRLPARSGKLDRLEELVDDAVDAGEKMLVFTQFATWGARLQAHLRQRLSSEVLYLRGSVSRTERDRMVAAFQDPAGPTVFVLSLKAGGVGLNLTAASHVVHYDRWWNPAVEDQATDRAFRIGQRRDVVVRKLVCAGTLEERIAQLIDQKKDLAERVVGSGEGWLTELSTQQLRDVVALGADAVA